MNRQIIFHIDVNNAFLSWTAVYLLKQGSTKDIRKVPSIIGGDEKQRRGIVLAKSPIAKKYGIKTAETIYSAKEKCKSLEIYPPNFSWYYKKSKELMKYLSQYSPSQEQLSVDECFLDMTGMHYIYNDLIELAYRIKEEVKEKFGYTVNIGIANNKLCAKMASDFEKPDKVHTLFSTEIEEKLWPLKVERLYMCGKKTSQELNKLGINTIGELANTSLNFLEKHFKGQGSYLKEAALGIDYSKVEARDSKNQSISLTETLPYNYRDEDKLKEIIFRQTEEVCRELRSKKLYCKTIGIIFKNSSFKSYSAQTTLNNSTDNTKIILDTAYRVFDDNYQQDDIRLIGIRLSNLTAEKNQQLSIFEPNTKENNNNVQKTIDTINNKFGKSVIKPAALTLVGESRTKKKYISEETEDG